MKPYDAQSGQQPSCGFDGHRVGTDCQILLPLMESKLTLGISIISIILHDLCLTGHEKNLPCKLS